MTSSSNTIEPLSSAFAGPGSSAYDEAAVSFNLNAPLRPIAATTVRTRDEARAAIRAARANGARVAPISTGHASALLGPVAKKVHVVRTVLDEPIRVDPDRGVVQIPAGTRWGDVVEAAAYHGYAVPHGSSPTVGAIGFLLNGGMSFYGRKVGVAANHVLSLTVALPDGEIVTVDADNDPELFWALRGGGGGFGIVLSAELRMFPMRTVLTGMIAWDASQAALVALGWAEWSRTAPRSVTTSMRLMNLPDVPETPEPLRGRQILAIDGTIMADEYSTDNAGDVLRGLVDPLQSLATPIVNTWHAGPVTDATLTHGDPQDPIAATGDSFSLAHADRDTIAAWFEAAGPASGGRLMMAELRQAGGAFAEVPETAGAFGGFEAELVSLNAGGAASPADHAATRDDLLRFRKALSPYMADRIIPSMVDDPHMPQRTLTDEAQERVDKIRERVDPEGTFEFDVRRSRDA